VASNLGFGKKSKTSGFSLGGSAARKLAIETTHNIANINIGSTGGAPDPSAGDDQDLAAVIELLRQTREPLPVATVAAKLGWDSEKTANALERGGQAGVLAFFRDAEEMTRVALASS